MENRLRAGWFEYSRKISEVPVEAWLILGLFISFLFFYFVPTFFRSNEAMAQGFEFINPAYGKIGADHYEIVNDMSRAFLEGKPRFVLRGPYPPFTILFHMPFTLVDTKTSYVLMSLLILAVFVVTTLVIPGRMQPRRWHPALVAIFFTGLLSYGLQFELERGQFNLVAVGCSLISVWLFHRHPRLRWLAYLLFSMAVQLKVYPAIFIINLVDDWRDWKGILKRFIGLGLLNFAMLFVLGVNNFLRFFGGVSGMATTANKSDQNHSIGSFVGQIIEKFPAYSKYTNYITMATFVFVLLCLALIVYQAYRNRFSGINPLLILSCAAAAQLIPRISYDYTLSILPAAMAFFLMGFGKIEKNLVTSLTLLVICTAYGSTLFATAYKYAVQELFPILPSLTNTFPVLLLILIAVTVLSFYFCPSQMPRSLE